MWRGTGEVQMNRYTLTKTDEIKRGAHAAFIDSDYNSSFSYRPEFLSNDHRQGKKVLSSIEAELSNCDEFCISVAFITMSGITPLLQGLRTRGEGCSGQNSHHRLPDLQRTKSIGKIESA